MAGALVLLGDDLRADDSPALAAAEGAQVVAPLYVLEKGRVRGAALWWLGKALEDLERALAEKGGRLFVMQGGQLACAKSAMASLGTRAVYLNAGVDAARDAALIAALKAEGAEVHYFPQSLRDESILAREGGGYRVFTAYHKAAAKLEVRQPRGATPPFESPAQLPRTVPVAEVAAHLEKGWTGRLASYWEPTAAGLAAQIALLPEILPHYAEERDWPFRVTTSRLSPYLRFGQIDPARLVRIVAALPEGEGRETFLRELNWREFARHCLAHHPDLPCEPLDKAFRAFPWRDDPAALKAWKKGRTGVPIVDAGMRQLWKTGWMHNRVRMICASYLVKDLLIDWRLGAEWFMETLGDADEASNALNWQWVAGSVPDAAPYFRVFNPLLQARKFDPDGYYVRKFVRELAFLPAEWVHTPEKAPVDVLADAELPPGTYPEPLVDHRKARERALKGLAGMREKVREVAR